MFEQRTDRVLSRRQFAIRQLKQTSFSALLVGISLALGAAGYHRFEHLNCLDSFYAASMILTGMGPVCEIKTDAGKVFVTAYALFSGVVFVSAATLLVAPLLHRLMHKFHVQDEREDGD